MSKPSTVAQPRVRRHSGQRLRSAFGALLQMAAVAFVATVAAHSTSVAAAALTAVLCCDESALLLLNFRLSSSTLPVGCAAALHVVSSCALDEAQRKFDHQPISSSASAEQPWRIEVHNGRTDKVARSGTGAAAEARLIYRGQSSRQREQHARFQPLARQS